MRKIIDALIWLLIVAGALQALATTPTPLPVQGNLVSILGPGQPYAGVSIQLQNCASPVAITGYSVIVQQGYQVQANPSGVVNTTVWPNDLINCNGTTGNSQYQLAYVVNGAIQGTPQCFQVLSTQGSWNLETQQSITCSQSAPNPQDGQYNNLNILGCLSYQGGPCINPAVGPYLPLTGGPLTGPVSIASTLSVKNNLSIGPRYDVTNSAFGAKGDGVTDDTAAIQAAFNACWNNTNEPTGGIVEFPGPHTYNVSATINIYDGCKPEGVTGNAVRAGALPEIHWVGTSSQVGTVVNITAMTLASNSTPYYTAAFPNIPGVTQNRTTAYVGTFTGTNTLTANQWVQLNGCSTTQGMSINRVMAQVVSSSGSAFIALLPTNEVVLGTVSDTCTATTVTVMMASDGISRYGQSISNLTFTPASQTLNPLSVAMLHGSRVDTGSDVLNVSCSSTQIACHYYSEGGINVKFDNGWRGDGNQGTTIFWRTGGNDSLNISNGTNDNESCGNSTCGVALTIDNAAACASMQLTGKNVKFEINSPQTPGLGAVTLYQCPTSPNEQLYVDTESWWFAPYTNSTAGVNISPWACIPGSCDSALIMFAANSQYDFGTGSNTSPLFIGLPSLTLGNLLGSAGHIPFLSYAPAYNSIVSTNSIRAPHQIFGDFNLIGQLWQYGINASAFLYTDTAYAALPNGTTLYAGQILAPPSYWNGANGKRYALDVVYTSGTTGTPNGGATNCTAAASASVMTCNSATDLSVGKFVSVNGGSRSIQYIDATNPAAVLVYTHGSIGGAGFSGQALTYLAPTLGLEMQLPTKSSSAPSSLAWVQGDLEQNSGAAAGGICGWVNTGAGTPGTWTAIPCGDASGKIADSQLLTAHPGISGTPTAGAGVCWKTASQLGTCTAGTWPNCSTCN